ncbi:MAG: TraR/DksA family transcriptional regulator [Bradymonadia bacterium]
MSTLLSEGQLNTLKTHLEMLLKELPLQIERARSGSKPVALDQQSVGRLSRMDAIAQQSVSKDGVHRLRLRHAQVLGAIRRMQSGQYGYCIRCDEDIGFKRLNVAPEVPMCIECQAHRENI